MGGGLPAPVPRPAGNDPASTSCTPELKRLVPEDDSRTELTLSADERARMLVMSREELRPREYTRGGAPVDDAGKYGYVEPERMTSARLSARQQIQVSSSRLPS